MAGPRRSQPLFPSARGRVGRGLGNRARRPSRACRRLRDPRPPGGALIAQTTIDRLIINPPYGEPGRHWRHEREAPLFDLVEGRHPAGYVVASGDPKAFDDPGLFVSIPLVNQVRPRVKAWRQAGYPGVSSITKLARSS